VYFSVFIILACYIAGREHSGAVSHALKMLDLSRHSLKRWRNWFKTVAKKFKNSPNILVQESFTSTNFLSYLLGNGPDALSENCLITALKQLSKIRPRPP
jgi:hypothetical protein